MQKKSAFLVFLGIVLCIFFLLLSIYLQLNGYSQYLDSDIASEILLAKYQHLHHHLIERDWLYSTEIRLFSSNLFYSLAFFFTDSFMIARIIGNTIIFIINMLSCYWLCRLLKLSKGYSLIAASLIPVTLCPTYAWTVTIGGFYITHFTLAYIFAALFFTSFQRPSILHTLLFFAVCLWEGFLSVRFLLCFACPLFLTLILLYILPFRSPQPSPSKFQASVLLTGGFVSFIVGYIFASILLPKLFVSGIGYSGSFVYSETNKNIWTNTIFHIMTDFIKLCGWHGGVSLFSLEGLGNLCIAGLLFSFTILCFHFIHHLKSKEDISQEFLIFSFALCSLFTSVFVFISIDGAYLNRYLLTALYFFIPAGAVMIHQEKNLFLKSLVLLTLCGTVSINSMLFVQDTVHQRSSAMDAQSDLREVLSILKQEKYQFGYGDFWDIRVIEELTNGEIQTAGIRTLETEEGAVIDIVPEMIRWLEPSDVTDINISEGPVFLILRHEKEDEFRNWLAFSNAPLVFKNNTYSLYSFSCSQSFINSMLWGSMKLTNASCFDTDHYLIQPNGRMRVPTTWRENGQYSLSFTVPNSSSGAHVRVYHTGHFELLSEFTIQSGENLFSFSLPYDDKYFMILFENNGSETIEIQKPYLKKD